MAMGRVRSTRKLKQWMIEQIDSCKYPGLVWDDSTNTMFRIPWKHAGKQDFRYDEDAAIFKAWAKFKGKFKDGDKIDPATWKTRLRCALNKSPEFAEVPSRSQLDISEPYKVYRIVPLKEQRMKITTGSTVKREKVKKEESGDSTTEAEEEKKERPPKPVMEVKPINMQVGLDSICDITSSTCTEDLSLDSSMEFDLDGKQDALNEIKVNMTIATAPPTTLLETGVHAMLITFYYGGLEVSKKIVHAKDCKISSASSSSLSRNGLMSHGMERIVLPPAECIEDPAKRQATEQLLTYLERGIMLASNVSGIFIQRHCQGRVFWKGPCAPHQNQPNKLERDNLIKLFDTKKFLEELELYRTGNGPVPEYQITLCFGEEFPDVEPVTDKLITIQIEQLFARQLLDEFETLHASLNLINDLAVEPMGTDRFSTTLREVSLSLYNVS